MDQPEHSKRRKGFFSDVWLPVAENYIYPNSRRAMLWVGGIGAVLLFALFAFDAVQREGVLVSNGPLSYNHALIADNCSSCHIPAQGAVNAKCATCHEKYGDDLGTYSFASHYLYHSADFDRAAPASQEQTCAGCHNEHQGLDASIITSTNTDCATCHDYDPFSEHPQFEFARENEPDNANLLFSHTQHVNEAMEQEGYHDVEQACLSCHQPEKSGAGFQALNFEVACASCHLGDRTTSPPIPLASSPGEPGALLPAALASLARPGAQQATYINPADFRTSGDRVRKGRVQHADPWIMQNLQLLREKLYPSAELAGLLRASADVPANEGARVQAEAIQT
ncbi:MAG: cytochrome c3 family protein, partial [Rhodothermales bacterium]